MPSAEDCSAISELLNRMAYFYDENHLDDLAACFAPDAMPPGPRSRGEAEHSQRLVTDRLYLSG